MPAPKKKPLSPAQLVAVSRLFAALAEPSRLSLLHALQAGPLTVSELIEACGMKQANVSKHLAALAQGGLIKRHKVGTSIYYAVADPAVYTLCDVVCASVQQRIAEEAQALGFETVPAPLQKEQNLPGS